MKGYKVLTLVIQVLLLLCTYCLASESPKKLSEEVDYNDEMEMDTEPRTAFQPKIIYATSPKEEEKVKKEMFGKVRGRFAIADYFQDNTKKGKLERQKHVRFLTKTEDNKWDTIDINTLGDCKTWNKTGKVKVLVHGFTSQITKKPKELIKIQYQFKLGDAYLEALKGNVNIIVVDWTCLSREPLFKYYEAADSCKYAGEATAKFLVQLVKKNLIASYKDIHILGHSLGSHVAGSAGYYVHQLTKSKVGRITGLDPAGALFEKGGKLPKDTSKALDKADALFVDILHCNTGNIVTTVGASLGTTVAAGHADFYRKKTNYDFNQNIALMKKSSIFYALKFHWNLLANGGKRQKRCNLYQDQVYGCSHQMSVKYFIESLTKPELACPCADWKTFKKGGCKCTVKSGGMYMGEACLERF
ncbi:unnamed protein product [Orchesella dallaii]|uniref:Lipase domain-containing protein n=1 Tax=Orchesella dallaii TaxID=48710 RepID=A0ABP1R0F8_9HEXA